MRRCLERAARSSSLPRERKSAWRKAFRRNIPPKRAPVDAQGTVVLKEVVDETGKVAGVRLVEGNAALGGRRHQAVKQWRYRPYVRDGKAQPFQTVVIIDFQRP